MPEESLWTPERLHDGQRERPAKARGRFATPMLVLLGVSLGLVLLETGASLAERGRSPKNGYSPVRGRRSREPLNAAGYRDVEHPKAKPPGVHRVVVVGDSFTYGAGVLLDDTYGKRLERALSASRSEPWEAVILSTPGIGTEEEEGLVREEAFAYSPDLLVLGYVLNDAEGHDDAERRRARAWSEADALKHHPPVWRKSALLRLIADRLHATRENRLRILNHLELYREGSAELRATRTAIARVAEQCREKRVPLVAAIFPLFANPLDDTYPFKPIHDTVALAFRSSGAVVVDLLPYYQGLDWRLLVVEGARDEHPNELAHRIAAQALLPVVEDVIPRRPASPERPRSHLP